VKETKIHTLLKKERESGIVKFQILGRCVWLVPYSTYTNRPFKIDKEIIDVLLSFPPSIRFPATLYKDFPNAAALYICTQQNCTMLDITEEDIVFRKQKTWKMVQKFKNITNMLVIKNNWFPDENGDTNNNDSGSLKIIERKLKSIKEGMSNIRKSQFNFSNNFFFNKKWILFTTNSEDDIIDLQLLRFGLTQFYLGYLPYWTQS